MRERRQLKLRDVFQRRVRVRQAAMPSTQAVVLAALKACLSTEFWIRGELMVDFVHAALGDQLSQDAVGLKLLVMARATRAATRAARTSGEQTLAVGPCCRPLTLAPPPPTHCAHHIQVLLPLPLLLCLRAEFDSYCVPK